MFGRKNCRKESTAWSERRVDRVAGDTKFVICYSSSVGEVVRLMWAVRHCIVRGYLTARSLCGRNSTFKHFFTHIAYLQCRSYAASQIQITNFWLKYYNCLKSVLYCLLKPVFFHHAVLYTSQNITLRPDYFDQEDELAFLGNILFVPVMQLVKFSGPSTQHNTHTHTTHKPHTPNTGPPPKEQLCNCQCVLSLTAVGAAGDWCVARRGSPAVQNTFETSMKPSWPLNMMDSR